MSRIPVSIELKEIPSSVSSTPNPVVTQLATQPVIQPQISQVPLATSLSQPLAPQESLVSTMAKVSPVAATADVAKETVRNPKTVLIIIGGILLALLIIAGVVYFIAEKFFGGISGLFNNISGSFNNISGSVSH